MLVVGLLTVAGAEVSWVVMMAGDCWAGRLGSFGGARWWWWLALAIELGCAVMGIE